MAECQQELDVYKSMYQCMQKMGKFMKSESGKLTEIAEEPSVVYDTIPDVVKPKGMVFG